MTSTLTWVDYDSEARDRSLRILALFQQKESRDELGLGGIRDSFADMLFLGTPTIQTRLQGPCTRLSLTETTGRPTRSELVVPYWATGTRGGSKIGF